MRIRRRSFLKHLGLGPVSVALAGRRGWAQVETTTCAVLLDLVGQEWDARISAVLSAFLDRGLPVAVMLDFPQAEDGPALPEPLVALLRAWPQMLELVGWDAGIATAPAYFQMRRASELNARIARAMQHAAPDLPRSAWPVTIAGDSVSAEIGLNGVRVAGFRNTVLRPKASAATTDADCPGPVTCAAGGLVVPLSQDPAVFGPALARAAGARGHVQVFLRPDADEADPAGLAEAVAGAADRGEIVPILPREQILRWEGDTSRWLGLCLVRPADDRAASLEGFSELAGRLRKSGVDFSTLVASDIRAPLDETMVPLLAIAGKTVSLPSDFEGYPPSSPVACDAAEPPAAVLARAGFRTLLRLPAAGDGYEGLDGQGLVRVGRSFALDGVRIAQPDAQLGPFHESLLIVPEEAYETRARRNSVYTTIMDLFETPGNWVTNGRRYASLRRLADPLHDLMMRTEARSGAIAARALDPARQDREALLRDARLAWSYFDETSDEATGLCPATVFSEEYYSSTHDKLTMWDLGSLIFAVVSAEKLGLIAREDARTRAGRILESLDRAAKANWSRLPPGNVDTTSPGQPRNDFNSCDTGRLLSALSALAASRMDPGGTAALVASWGLERTVTDGMFHSLRSGSPYLTHASHCAHYASRAFAGWGIDAWSPYERAMVGETEADARMGLLYGADAFGPMGAEPLLLEAIEFGYSRPAVYLAKVLFGAQMEAHEKTGGMFCVSEGPLPEKPWFTYQGLDLADPAEPWKVSAIDPSPAYRSAQFREKNLVTSTKAAFLWAACHPHPYSRKLLDYVRSRARRPEGGFSAGIYMETGVATENYTDVNTNGIILQCVARMLSEPAAAGPR